MNVKQQPKAQVTRDEIQRYARLHHRYRDDLGSRELVLPNADYFPDEFVGDPDSAVLLALRMQEHAQRPRVRVVEREPVASRKRQEAVSLGWSTRVSRGCSRSPQPSFVIRWH